jgi:tetratricopeptide (TPR) repeat protein
MIDAGAALQKALEVAPDLPDVILLEGRLAERNKREDLALAHYRRFLDLKQDDLEVRLFLAKKELGEGGDRAKAIEHLEAAKKCFPRYLGKDSPYVLLAQLHRGAGKMDLAIRELEAFAEIAAEDYGVRKELKAWYRSKSNHAAVARVSEEMIDVSPFGANPKDPPDLALHRDFAEALLALNRRDEALRERIVQVELISRLPEEVRIGEGEVDDRMALGDLLLDMGRPDEALEQAVGALRLAPDHAGARILKARAMEAGGNR